MVTAGLHASHQVDALAGEANRFEEDAMVRQPQSSSAAYLPRRALVGGLSAAVAPLGLGASGGSSTARAAAPVDYSDHPVVGTWMVMTPSGPSLAVFFADGTNIQGVPTAQAGPQGVTFTGAQVGTWEPDGDRRIHFTGVQLHTDATGAFVGTVTIDGHPRVSEDGQSLIDDAPETTITIRDAANTVLDVVKPFPGGPPVTGVRMGVGSPGFPPATPTAGTPTA